MFLLTKFALATCAVYLGIAVLIDGAIFAMVQWKRAFGVSVSRTGWLVFFGVMWLISFLISWRIVIAPVFARIHRI